VSSLADLVALARTGVIAGAIVGRALYEGRIELRAALDAVAAC
jgi:phosphoribosylformimino-5-aminoimidazole carboxamide ribotide isomerase